MFDAVWSWLISLLNFFWVEVLSITVGPLRLYQWIVSIMLIGGLLFIIMSAVPRIRTPHSGGHLRRVRGGDLENG